MTISIEAGLVSWLLGYTDLTEKVSDRVYPLLLPQSSDLPAITYTRISTVRVMTHDQNSGGLAMPRFQFDVYAESFSEVIELAGILRSRLLGFRGEFGSTEKVMVYGVLHELEQDMNEPEIGMYHKIIDYSIRHKEG